AFACAYRGSDSCRTCAHDQYIGVVHSAITFMPFAHNVWQLRTCGTSSTVTRHSKQIPIPHSGPRGSPQTDRLNVLSPAIRIATATVVPAGTSMRLPFTDRVTVSGMKDPFPFGQVRIDWNCRLPAENLVGKEPGGRERRRNA